MTQQTTGAERRPSLPTPNTSFILWCQAPDYSHAGPVNSSPYKRVRNKVYCKAVITSSGLADLCAGHMINSNWPLSPAWGRSEILHSLAGNLQTHSVCERIQEFPSSLPPRIPSHLSFLNPSTQFFIQLYIYSFIHEFIYSFIYSWITTAFIYNHIHSCIHS